MPNIDISKIQNFFFIGIAGDGMCAIAQYLSGLGKTVSGSDRQFSADTKNTRQIQLENENISCFPQDTTGLNPGIELVVISTAIEPTVPEYKKAMDLDIPVVMRSDLLSAISNTMKTIAIGGTSGKSTVTAMVFHILKENGYNPSLITGAGLVSLQEEGKIGNSYSGSGEYLVIEADESDGSIVKYTPEIGLLLNIDKDHKEIEELEDLFSTFVNHSNHVIVNRSRHECIRFSKNSLNDFGYSNDSGFHISNFKQNDFIIRFNINEVSFELTQPGLHNAENAAAAVAACSIIGIAIEDAAKALQSYKGIYRRHQIIASVNNINLIDDYAHNPAKLSASIKACQLDNSKLYVWFQPHGFKPTKFLKDDFVKEISAALRPDDEIWMSEIYYAGGTVEKDISSNDLIIAIKMKGKKAFFIESRSEFPKAIKPLIKPGDVILLTGARDPSLNEFAEFVKLEISS